jgi:hypothetical protein
MRLRGPFKALGYIDAGLEDGPPPPQYVIESDAG